MSQWVLIPDGCIVFITPAPPRHPLAATTNVGCSCTTDDGDTITRGLE